jgi:hypothetical protein
VSISKASFIIRFNNDYFKRSKHPSSDKRYTHGTTIGLIYRNKTLFHLLDNIAEKSKKFFEL